MIRIILTEEQTNAIARSSEPIDLVDGSGRMLGRMTPMSRTTDPMLELSAEELAEIDRRMANAEKGNGVFYTTQEVLEHLESLETE